MPENAVSRATVESGRLHLLTAQHEAGFQGILRGPPRLASGGPAKPELGLLHIYLPAAEAHALSFQAQALLDG